MSIHLLYPKQLSNASFGVLIGSYSSTLNCFCVVGITKSALSSQPLGQIKDLLNRSDHVDKTKIRIIGVQVQPNESTHSDSLISVLEHVENKPCIILRNFETDPQVAVIHNGLPVQEPLQFHKLNLFLYDFTQICADAQFCHSHNLPYSKGDVLESTTSMYQNNVDIQHRKHLSINPKIISLLYEAHHDFAQVANNVELKLHAIKVKQRFNNISKTLLTMWSFILLVFSQVANLSTICLQPQFIVAVLKKALTFSSFGSQVLAKARLVSTLKHNRNELVKSNIALSLILDACLGAALYYMATFIDGQLDQRSFQALMSSVKYIGKEVEQLIQWLMGIPIGLKLNSPLNQFLGKFFLHHVQLWLEYVQLMLSTLQAMTGQDFFLRWPLTFACFGLSFFLALISDVVSLLSFHIYCFYVYAARLYRLQFVGLLSLWRLFRGKKWNPLRQRVDTLCDVGESENPRFFLGTLLFTVLLFLLPTTALYYAIFTALRVMILVVQNFLTGTRNISSCFPWCSVAVRKWRPLAFPGKARFRILSDNVFAGASLPNSCDGPECGPFTFEITVEPQSYPVVIKHSFMQMYDVSSVQGNFKAFVTSVFTGKLLKWS